MQLVCLRILRAPGGVGPGAIVRDRDGKLVGTLTLDVLDRQIQTIRAVANPDKLRHLGPVADPWAFAREVKQARRPND
jgi:RNA polymerase sigma-70 factor (ECF subfamily)